LYRNPFQPDAAIADTAGSSSTGNAAHLTSQKITLKMRATAVGLTGVRNVSVSQDASRNAGLAL